MPRPLGADSDETPGGGRGQRRGSFPESSGADVCKVVGGWKARARKLGLTSQECAEAEHLYGGTAASPGALELLGVEGCQLQLLVSRSSL